MDLVILLRLTPRKELGLEVITWHYGSCVVVESKLTILVAET